MSTNLDLLDQLRRIGRLLASSYEHPTGLWLLGDINGDGVIDRKDLALFTEAFNTKAGDADYNPAADLNMDGVIDLLDMKLLSLNYGLKSATIPWPTPGVIGVEPGMLPEDAWKRAEAAAEVTQGDYQTLSLVPDSVTVFGTNIIDIDIFGQPGWKARTSRAIDTFNAPFTAGVLPILEAYWRYVFRPALPSVQDLPHLLTRLEIFPSEFLNYAAYLGLSDRLAVSLLATSYELPELRELQALLWRGQIDEIGFKDGLLKQGWHPDVVDQLYQLAWQIPGPQDLVRFVVREVISPADFITWIGRQGFSSYWASAYWDAHFVLPGPQFLYDAFHRGIITDVELEKYIFWHDYQPTPRPGISRTDLEIMRALTKTLIPRVDLRRGWALGVINDAELVHRYEYLGYEDDAGLMAEIQKATVLGSHVNAVASQYLAALRKGVKTETQVRSRLKALKLPPAAIDLLIEVENVRREIGAVPAEVEPARDVRSAAAALYREGYLSSDEFEGFLRAANYSDDDIARVRTAEDLRYRLDYLTDLQAMMVEAYKKDVLTQDELCDQLIALGMQKERADALVAKEVYKKLPKPKV